MKYPFRFILPEKKCRDPGSNRGPLDLQSNALPTELSQQLNDNEVIYFLFTDEY